LERAEESDKSKKNRVAKWVNFGNKTMLLNMMSDDGITAAIQISQKNLNSS
jgi:hypothetical protein